MTTYYERYVNKILEFGAVRRPRGMATISLQDVTFATKVGRTYRRAKDNPLIGFMEGLQFVAGAFEPKEIARIAPNAKLELFTDQAAYGPRVGFQLHGIVEELRADPWSRRAVMQLAYPFEPLADRPCTTSLQFRADQFGVMFDTLVTMRSSDAVWGLPYDLIQFGMMAQVVAACTRMVACNLVIRIGDAHIYESTLPLLRDMQAWEFAGPTAEKDVSWYQSMYEMNIPFFNKDVMHTAFNFHQVGDDG